MLSGDQICSDYLHVLDSHTHSIPIINKSFVTHTSISTIICIRCAVQGGVHIAGAPGGECHEPLTRGPCPDNQVRSGGSVTEDRNYILFYPFHFMPSLLPGSRPGRRHSDGQVRNTQPYLLLTLMDLTEAQQGRC